MLCDLVLQGVTGSLKALAFDAGKEFDVVVVSIDPEETPELAAETEAPDPVALRPVGHRGRLALPDRRRRTPIRR